MKMALLVALCLLALGVAPVVTVTQAAKTEPLVKTGRYRLDTGHVILWWIDDAHGVFCSMTLSDPDLSCVPLSQTTYAQEVRP